MLDQEKEILKDCIDEYGDKAINNMMNDRKITRGVWRAFSSERSVSCVTVAFVAGLKKNHTYSVLSRMIRDGYIERENRTDGFTYTLCLRKDLCSIFAEYKLSEIGRVFDELKLTKKITIPTSYTANHEEISIDLSLRARDLISGYRAISKNLGPIYYEIMTAIAKRDNSFFVASSVSPSLIVSSHERAIAL